MNSKIDITTLGFSDAEAVKNYLIDNEGIITSVSQYSELAMNNKGLRIGDAKKEIRGSLTLTLSRPVSAVEIVAYTCGFALNGSTQTIQITCGPNRAVISKLIFYY